MNEFRLELYWHDIPIGKANAVDYAYLSERWGKVDREVRKILHNLSAFDNGDDYILIRSSKGRGFYKTDDPAEIESYKAECLQKGRSVFAPVKKINRVLSNNAEQFTLENNLRTVREMRGLQQKEVCDYLKQFDTAIDTPMLSKMENGVCLPTPFQLEKLAALYGVPASELIYGELYETRIMLRYENS